MLTETETAAYKMENQLRVDACSGKDGPARDSRGIHTVKQCDELAHRTGALLIVSQSLKLVKSTVDPNKASHQTASTFPIGNDKLFIIIFFMKPLLLGSSAVATIV